MRFRSPELYSAIDDEQSRTDGNVYINDLALSGVAMALKISAAPHRFGVIHYKPVGEENVEDFHDTLATVVDGVASHTYPNPSYGDAFGADIMDIIVEYRTAFTSTPDLSVIFDYWDGRPIKTSFHGGTNLDSELFGFKSFNSAQYDDYQQSPGLAQTVIDALRTSENPFSLEVSINEGGRTFVEADELRSRLAVSSDPELETAILEGLDRIDEARG
jgi:hypothetical protein